MHSDPNAQQAQLQDAPTIIERLREARDRFFHEGRPDDATLCSDVEYWLQRMQAAMDDLTAELRSTGAPATPQPWFEPVMPPAPPVRLVGLIGGVEEEFKSVYDAERAVGPGQYWDANADARKAWEATRERERHLQWPAAWADEMLKRR